MSATSESFSTMSSAIEHVVNYPAWIINSFRPFISGPRLLEVGTGYGTYRSLLPEIEDYTTVDIDKASLDKAKKLNPNDSYVYIDAASPEFLDALGNKIFNSVICANVLEHIENDTAALRNLVSVLAPQGNLMLFVPAHEYLFSDLDHLAGHLRRYTKKSLRTKIHDLEAKEVCLEYFNPIGGLGWWLNKFRSIKSLNDDSVNAQIVMFDRFILPISRVFNPLTKSFFGQSLICVLRK